MIAKVAGEGFKIYSLCEANYLLAFDDIVTPAGMVKIRLSNEKGSLLLRWIQMRKKDAKGGHRRAGATRPGYVRRRPPVGPPNAGIICIWGRTWRMKSMKKI